MSSDAYRQKRHFEDIHGRYEEHYYDAESLWYRRRFILEPLLEKVVLDGRVVIEVACGTGHSSQYLLRQGRPRSLVGVDVSWRACRRFKGRVARPAVLADICALPFRDATVDLIFAVGGFHHCAARIELAGLETSRVLADGGELVIVEPNRGYLLQLLRMVWYRLDPLFEHSTERALDPSELVDASHGALHLTHVRFFGGPAYYLVLNSLIFRLARPLKIRLSRLLMSIERLFEDLPKPIGPAFLAIYSRHSARRRP